MPCGGWSSSVSVAGCLSDSGEVPDSGLGERFVFWKESAMTRMYKALTTVFGCAAVVLLVLAVLAVPTQQARADDGPGCQGQSCDLANPCPTGFFCVSGTC